MLVDIGLGGDDGDEAAHELDIAVDVAFEPGANQPKLLADSGVNSLAMNNAVLMLGENAGQDRDGKGNSGGDRARSQ
ncbi:MAG: hypothetical protein WAU86_01415, partial [Oricola sp.]